jgi:cephalosporin-C deacetylase
MKATKIDISFQEYWESLDSEVGALVSSPVEADVIPIRSSEFYTVYSLRIVGVGQYPLFAYLSVPAGAGPFPALFQAPGYGSVVGVPANERKTRYVVMALCHRGQRLSDKSYQAAYPGVLTDGIENATMYRWRAIVADCLRGVDVLLNRPDVDVDHVGATGNDLALIVSALRPQIRATLLNGPLIFRDAAARFDERVSYPFEEFNDYLRTYPENRAAVGKTLSLFDPVMFADRLDGEVLLSTEEKDELPSLILADEVAGRSEVSVKTGRGYVDHVAEERWLWRSVMGEESI